MDSTNLMFCHDKLLEETKAKTRDLLSCQLCTLTFRDARGLPCGHAFCLHCLQALYRNLQAAKSPIKLGSFSCPTCGTLIGVPRSGVEGFPADKRAEQIREQAVDEMMRKISRSRKERHGIGVPSIVDSDSADYIDVDIRETSSNDDSLCLGSSGSSYRRSSPLRRSGGRHNLAGQSGNVYTSHTANPNLERFSNRMNRHRAGYASMRESKSGVGTGLSRSSSFNTSDSTKSKTENNEAPTSKIHDDNFEYEYVTPIIGRNRTGYSSLRDRRRSWGVDNTPDKTAFGNNSVRYKYSTQENTEAIGEPVSFRTDGDLSGSDAATTESGESDIMRKFRHVASRGLTRPRSSILDSSIFEFPTDSPNRPESSCNGEMKHSMSESTFFNGRGELHAGSFREQETGVYRDVISSVTSDNARLRGDSAENSDAHQEEGETAWSNSAPVVNSSASVLANDTLHSGNPPHSTLRSTLVTNDIGSEESGRNPMASSIHAPQNGFTHDAIFSENIPGASKAKLQKKIRKSASKRIPSTLLSTLQSIQDDADIPADSMCSEQNNISCESISSETSKQRSTDNEEANHLDNNPEDAPERFQADESYSNVSSRDPDESSELTEGEILNSRDISSSGPNQPDLDRPQQGISDKPSVASLEPEIKRYDEIIEDIFEDCFPGNDMEFDDDDQMQCQTDLQDSDALEAGERCNKDSESPPSISCDVILSENKENIDIESCVNDNKQNSYAQDVGSQAADLSETMTTEPLHCSNNNNTTEQQHSHEHNTKESAPSSAKRENSTETNHSTDRPIKLSKRHMKRHGHSQNTSDADQAPNEGSAVLQRISSEEYMMPTAIALLQTGCTVVADYGLGSLQYNYSDGSPCHKLDNIKPFSVAISRAGDQVIVGDRKNRTICIYDDYGGDVAQWDSNLFGWICGIGVLNNGNLAVLDRAKSKIGIYTTGGDLISEFGSYGSLDSQLCMGEFLAVDSNDRIITCDSGNHCIKVFSAEGRLLGNYGAGRGEADDGELQWPKGVCVDSRDNIIVADTCNNRVSMFSPSGAFVQHLVTNVHAPYALYYREPDTIALTLYSVNGSSQYRTYSV